MSFIDMFNLYFRVDTKKNQYIYKEQGLEYKMSLFMMLKFKRHYRKQIYFPGTLPIASWLLTLSKEEMQQVGIIGRVPQKVFVEG